ncbi:MAG: hypothetical protein ABJB03_05035 [Rhodoglobus sp.]
MRLLPRLGLAFLALNELVVGAWNQFWPESFYATFPTVDLTPPFSEHFARDFGGATLGIGVLLLVAVIRPLPAFVLMATLAYSIFAVPHFVFHLQHLAGTTAPQAVALTATNAAVAGIGVALFVGAVVWMRRAGRLRPE